MSLAISLSPIFGKIGDPVTITATSDTFLVPFNNNVVTFAGLDFPIIADILTGTSTELKVLVPPNAITGLLTVETLEVDNEIATADFEVVYDDISFEQEEVPFQKASINGRVKTVGTNPSTFPLYNKDLAFSNFVEVFDENSMIQNVFSIILTGIGERMFSDFGTRISELLFKPIFDEDNFKAELMDEIIRSVSTFEPRVTIIKDKSFIVIVNERVDVILSLEMPRGTVEEVGITLKSVRNFA